MSKDPACPVCSQRPTITSLIDYERFCAAPAAAAPSELEIAPRDLARWRGEGRDPLLLDVRTPAEAALAALPEALLLPLDELPRRLDELDRARPTVVHCHLGLRSLAAVQLLREHGFAQAWSLRGGSTRGARKSIRKCRGIEIDFVAAAVPGRRSSGGHGGPPPRRRMPR